MRLLLVCLSVALALNLVSTTTADARAGSRDRPSAGSNVEPPRSAKRPARAAKHRARKSRHVQRSVAQRQQARRKARRAYAKAATRVRPARVVRRVGAGDHMAGSNSGIASFYWQGHTTASGARFNPDGMTAAHRTLPFGTRVRVTHLGNGRSVTVTINDRGPFIGGRIIDLSRGAAGVLGMHGQGLAQVRMDILGR